MIKENSLIKKLTSGDFVVVARKCEFLEREKLIEEMNRSPYEGIAYVLTSSAKGLFQLGFGYLLLKSMKNIGP